ncbi:hypothetical protein ACLBW8_18675 [Pseudomonas sp. M5A4_2d]
MREKIGGLITGAGAVANAWNPVIRALQSYYDFPLTSDSANSILARLIYLVRWYSSLKTEHGATQYKTHLELLNEIKTSISRELKKAQDSGEITVRASLIACTKLFLLSHSKKFAYITTNWDSVGSHAIKKELNKTHHVNIYPLHIHGHFDAPSGIYLPTEMVKEPYRSSEEEMTLGSTHGMAWRALEPATRIILFGLSLSPLDAELQQIVACGLDFDCKKEVIIVDPNHNEIAQRINLLINPARNISVTGYHPDDLAKKHTYTIKRQNKKA